MFVKKVLATNTPIQEDTQVIQVLNCVWLGYVLSVLGIQVVNVFSLAFIFIFVTETVPNQNL